MGGDPSAWELLLDRVSRIGSIDRRYDLGNVRIGDGRTMNCEGERKWVERDHDQWLYETWGPPAESPWAPFHRPTLFAAISNVKKRAYPRPVPGLDAKRAPEQGPDWAGPEHAVVLDLPGTAAVAYGAWLARHAGYQPVATFNNWPHKKGLVDMEPVLAAMIHFTPWVRHERERLGETRAAQGVLAEYMAEKPAPPVFLLDDDRLGPKGRKPKPKDFDNRYYLLDSDLPTAAMFKRAGIRRVVYVRPDPWSQERGAGQTGRRGGAPAHPGEEMGRELVGRQRVEEMDDLNRYLNELAKGVGLDLAVVPTTEWGWQPAEPFKPTLRDTVFSTVKDPRFRGFRRTAAGGFGKMVPEPSSGAG